MTAIELARSIFPEASVSDEELNYIIWNETGFPCFFKEGDSLELQLREVRRRIINHIPLPSEEEDAEITLMKVHGKWPASQLPPVVF